MQDVPQSKDDHASVGDRLTAIEHQLQHLPRMLAAIEELTERIIQLEDNAHLNADFHRYSSLRDCLVAGEWRKADEETIRIILDLTGEPDLNLLTPEQVAQMSCNDLRVIDQLWQRYSNGRYGFGVQLRIYQEEGGTIETTIAQDQTIIIRLGKRVGWWGGDDWLKCDQLDYTGNAPDGCLPARWWNSPFGAKMTNTFFRRLLECS